jgi:hypothetical protein
MTNEITTYQQADLPALSAEQVRARVNLIQQVMKGVMKPGVHYGTIPGTDKPTLYKPGAETLAVTFRIAIDPLVDDLSTDDEAHIRVTCRGISQDTGAVLGSGIGEASSNEERYHWRKAVCDEEFEATAEDRRRVKWAKGKGGSIYTVKQVRTVPADVANTVLKQAKKRAQVDMTLSITGASDIFAQDIEDLPAEMRSVIAEEQKSDGDQARIGPVALMVLEQLMVAKGITEKQAKANLSRKEHFTGELTEMSTGTWERLCAGLAKMPDVQAEPEKKDTFEAGYKAAYDAVHQAEMEREQEKPESPIATDANGEVIDQEPEDLRDVPGAGPEEIDDFWPADDADGMHNASNPTKGETVTTGEVCTEKQRKLVYAKSKAAGVDDDSLHQIIRMVGGVESSRDLPFDKVDDVLTAIAGFKPRQEAMA